MSAAGSRWRPRATPDTGRRRAAMLDRARRFLAAHGVLEVETPALSRGAASDTAIESVQATLAADPGRTYYLHTSPEFAMKRLLAAGWPDIYQVARVFRDAEVGPRHQPEFTLVEWYRRDFTLDAMIDHTADFIAALIDPALLASPTRKVSYVEAFAAHAGVHPLDDGRDALAAASGVERALEASLGDDRDAWLDLLLTARVAPAFARDGLTVLHHYPATQAALARRCPDEPRLADRFEVFFGELELANGYVELTDADEQRRRCREDQARRRQQGKAVRPLDAPFLESLAHGLPPCAGVAVGFDRLVMLDCATEDVRDVLTFPFPEDDDE